MLSGCAGGVSSLFDFRRDFRSAVDPMTGQDYHDQMIHLGELFLRHPQTRQVTLDPSDKAYLTRLYQRIVSSNELLLGSLGEGRPQFYVIDSQTPFYFSLPGSHFYFSNVLIDRFLTSEELFTSMLTHEIVRSRRGVYKKNVIVPSRYLTLEQMISFTRIDLDLKMEVHKWAYFTLKRSGLDSSAYLSWLQLQNKNSLDFSLQVGSSRNISQEEFMFKNFIVTDVGTLVATPDFQVSTEYSRFVQGLRQ